MKTTLIIAFVGTTLLASCGNNPAHKGKPIVMGDPSTIVTEVDSQYLKNFTDDISPVDHKSSEGAITKMMVQVDSANASKKINEETATPKSLNGFTIHFEECEVVFDGLAAHALNNNQDERTLNSVSYVKDGGDILNMNLAIQGLQDIRVEERIITKLMVSNEDDTYILQDLHKFISPWYNLAGKDNRFVSVSNNSIQFHPFDAAKLKNALDRELRKKKIVNSEINAILKKLAPVASYSDEPCKIIIASVQWRIFGMKDGKKVQKLIQFDQPL
jgi:hypothetical protein